MLKVAWLFSVHAIFLIASEAENIRTKNTCRVNVTITVDQIDKETKVEEKQTKKCSKYKLIELVCKTVRTIEVPPISRVLDDLVAHCRRSYIDLQDKEQHKKRCLFTFKIRKAPKQQTVVRCCEGYVNETGVCIQASSSCKDGFYGRNCKEKCSCKEKQYKECTVTGKCICKDGWIGENCSQACENSKYGKNCEWDCSCRNNATCDHINGSCNCSIIQGWTGNRCHIKCPPSLYGPNCSLPCNCSNDKVCDHQTGRCSCKAGKTGHECGQNCSRLNFGINCEQPCSCDDRGTNYCDPVNGRCICRNGWMGSTCSEECQYGKFGKDCTQNCTCNETELCNKEDGLCQLVDVCVSNNTKNCIANIPVVKCDSLKNLCNDTEQRNAEKGLEKSAAELCCRDIINQDYSLCLSHVKCSCNEISSGTHCEAPQIMNSHQSSAQGLDNEDGSAVVPAAVATTLSIITIAVVIVVVVVIRRRRNKKRRPPVVHNQIYGASELDVVEGVIANDGHVTSSDTYDHVNRHNQRTDAKRNSNVYSSTTDNRETEYDISSRVTRYTDVNRNSNVYSSTTVTNDNEYDVSSHVRRNRDVVRNSNIYSATTNTHESEYDVSSHLEEHSSLINGDDTYSCDHLVRGDNVGDGDKDMYDHMTRNVEKENYNTLENHI